jgi:hypothetical protein
MNEADQGVAEKRMPRKKLKEERAKPLPDREGTFDRMKDRAQREHVPEKKATTTRRTR